MSAPSPNSLLKWTSATLAIAALVLWTIASVIVALDQPPGPPPDYPVGPPPEHPAGAVPMLMAQLGILAAGCALVVDVYRRIRAWLDGITLALRRVLAELAGPVDDSGEMSRLDSMTAAEVYRLGQRSQRRRRD